MSEDKIHAIGVWTLRLALVGGAIGAGIYGKDEVSGTCVVGLIWSFFFL